MKRANGAARTARWKTVLFYILLVTLCFSVVYSLIGLIRAPERTTDIVEGVKTDYGLMLFQSLIGLVVMFIPAIIERRWMIDVPDPMEILYFIFLYCAIYLGEVRNFYYLVPNWDTILHCFSGAMLGALGFLLVSLLNSAERVPISLSPFFVALFAFCFALACGAVWEIFEYGVDSLLHTNMQKFMLADGTELIGHAALRDTMKDLIVDAGGALVIVLVGVLLAKSRNRKTPKIV